MIEPARRKNILRKREDTLCRLLAQAAPSERVAKATEQVREAMLSFFKGQAEIAKYRETDNQKLRDNVQRHLEGLDERIAQWQCMGHQEIIALYERRASSRG